jgi:hypothetical protein
LGANDVAPDDLNIGGAIVPSPKPTINLERFHGACTGFERIRKAGVHSSAKPAGIVEQTNQSGVMMEFGFDAN